MVSGDQKRLLGAVLVGEAADYGNLLQFALNGIALPAHPEELILPAREGGAKKGLGVELLPDSATICSCNNVSKGALCSAVAEGCTSLGALKKCTKAGTSCGGCAALVKQVLDAELKAQGFSISNHLCEHFPHSRQELFHLVKLGGLKSFDAVLLKHGQGRGCDICKPTVASILASVWNEHILKPRHAAIQDSNDYYLANLQKDGSYSVVPRIPGGEITPEKLIVIGQVAQRYGLYTKITGGQRIDLFGARVEQLPLIWKALVDAGFESGHAYGKSMRTVKSCVGSTWCRYGVQDSVGMAIRLEQRYRGLRSPHKIKLAVSGCTRECAEAQGKDVGIIATDLLVDEGGELAELQPKTLGQLDRLMPRAWSHGNPVDIVGDADGPRPDGVGGLCGRRSVDVTGHHRGSGRGERLRQRPADTRTRPGDDGHRAFDLHGTCLPQPSQFPLEHLAVAVLG